MKVLITAATQGEFDSLKDRLPDLNIGDEIKFSFLNTGVGIPSTIFRLLEYIHAEKPDLCINIGIAGSFRHDLSVGDICFLRTDMFGDLAAELPDGNLVSMFELGFIQPDEFPFTNQLLINPNFRNILEIKEVNNSTVQKVHGNEKQITMFIKKYPYVDIETMESAAVFYVCLQKNISFLCLRAISNFIEPRNKDNWNIPLAINNLHNFFCDNIIKIIRHEMNTF